jgi:hypothetical protein
MGDTAHSGPYRPITLRLAALYVFNRPTSFFIAAIRKASSESSAPGLGVSAPAITPGRAIDALLFQVRQQDQPIVTFTKYCLNILRYRLISTRLKFD